MTKKTKRKLWIAIAALIGLVTAVVAGVLVLQYQLFWMEGRLEPFSERNISDSHFVMEGDSCYYLLDTGFSSSTIYDDEPRKYGENLSPVMYTIQRDVFNRRHLTPRYYCDSLKIDFIHSGCTYVDFLPSRQNFIERIIPGDRPRKPLFVIGMNLINQANWLFDMRNQRINCLPKHQKRERLPGLPAEYSFVLPYSLGVTGFYTPRTCLDMNGVRWRSKIDTGFGGMFHIKKKDAEVLSLVNPTTKPVKSISAFGTLESSKNTQYSYYEPVVRLNNTFDFADAQIVATDLSDQRLLGKKFFDRFSYVFLDTDERKFYFYGPRAK